MFFLDLIKVGNLRWFILSGGFCFAAGYMTGKLTTKEKIVTTIKTEYVGKASTVNTEQAQVTDKLLNHSKSNVTSVGTSDKKTKTKRNIVTQTRTYKKDGTVTETVRTDTSTIDDSTRSFDGLTGSLSNSADKTTSTNINFSSESHLTQGITTTSSVTTSVSSGSSAVNVGLGFSYRWETDHLTKFDSDFFRLDNLGISSELKIYSLGVQAQIFGDGSLVGTVKIWL